MIAQIYKTNKRYRSSHPCFPTWHSSEKNVQSQSQVLGRVIADVQAVGPCVRLGDQSLRYTVGCCRACDLSHATAPTAKTRGKNAVGYINFNTSLLAHSHCSGPHRSRIMMTASASRRIRAGVWSSNGRFKQQTSRYILGTWQAPQNPAADAQPIPSRFMPTRALTQAQVHWNMPQRGVADCIFQRTHTTRFPGCNLLSPTSPRTPT